MGLFLSLIFLFFREEFNDAIRLEVRLVQVSCTIRGKNMMATSNGMGQNLKQDIRNSGRRTAKSKRDFFVRGGG